MPYIYSTLSNSQSVVVYLPYPGSKDTAHRTGSANPSQRQAVININGGANVIERNLETPKGVVTEVTNEQLEALAKSSVFNRWVDRGFVTVEKEYDDADHVATNMVEKDASAQITTDDHVKRFEDGDTSADVVVDDPKPRTRQRKPKKAPAANKE